MSGYDNTSETVRVVAGATTLTNNDYVLFVKGATGAAAVTLPLIASVQPGRPYTVVKDGAAFAITLTASGSDTINGGATLALAASAYHGATIVNTGTEWVVADQY